MYNTMGSGPSVFIHMNKDDLFDPDDFDLCELISDKTADGDACPADGYQLHPDFHYIAIPGWADKIDFGHKFGNQAFFTQMTHGKNGGFFIDPAKQYPTEQGASWIEILWFYKFSAKEFHDFTDSRV